MSDESNSFSAQDIARMEHFDHGLLEEIIVFSNDHDQSAVYGVFMHYLVIHHGRPTWFHKWIMVHDQTQLNGLWSRAVAEYAELVRTQQTGIIAQKYANYMTF